MKAWCFPAAVAVVAALGSMLPSACRADIRLPALLSDNMVLQRNTRVTLWGTASPGEPVAVSASWGPTAHAVAGSDGGWLVRIPTTRAGGPYTITFRGDNTVTLHNVMLGEVWVCSGQSNMEFTVRPSAPFALQDASHEIAAANWPLIRMFNVVKNTSSVPIHDCRGSWQVCSPQTVGDFSAVGYFFARSLYQRLLGAAKQHVPIGMIHSSWGGTEIELWMSEPALQAVPGFAARIQHYQQAQEEAKNARATKRRAPFFRIHSTLFNAMIAPLLRYRIRGVIWYQGESNVGRGAQYAELFPAMIADWRSQWGEGAFPFYYVQIAPWIYSGNAANPSSPSVREAQLKTLSVPHTGMAVTWDISPDYKNIHPADKQDVGWRLALWAFADTYHLKGIVPSGPLFRSMKRDGDRLLLSFDHPNGGLHVDGPSLQGIQIAGADRVFHRADARVDNWQLLVWSHAVPEPVAVRYGWCDYGPLNLFNGSGLPASPFRTDSWPDPAANGKW
ncbi:MAG: sialate O-acetylesterase [Armatimonadetes bacterium]|nr:sialate O-acetylesterase [Armatimonadota bacterium]MDE2207829.1 sialate O-acetylesterase [Armatimonadota bacterium]